MSGGAILTVPVCLVGMPGCGKTTLGKELAKKLGAGFLDSDHEIERRTGKTVTDIFKQQGEAAFRTIEYETIATILALRPAHIIASGGGAFVQEHTRALMKEQSVTLWLKPSLDLIYNRVVRKHTRPLLEHGDKRKILEALAEQRYNAYAHAHLTFADDSPEEAPHAHIAESLREMLRTHSPSPLRLP